MRHHNPESRNKARKVDGLAVFTQIFHGA
jgi:hypothetical protein